MRFWLAFGPRVIPLVVRHLVDGFMTVYVGACVLAAWVLKLKSKWGLEDGIVFAPNWASVALVTAALYVLTNLFISYRLDINHEITEAFSDSWFLLLVAGI